ncbi:MAG TPA: sulfite exporter TauE/SafE family protein [Actinomycetota bacterium]
MSGADVVIAVLTGLVAGGYAGLLGVGGGIVMVPVMVILLGLEQQVAQGTSLVVIIVTATAGTVANARRKQLDGRLAALLGIGGVAGSVAGALLAVQVLGEDALKRVFGAVLVTVAVRMLVPALRPRESGRFNTKGPSAE